MLFFFNNLKNILKQTLVNFSIDGLISLSISFGSIYEVKFCIDCSPVVSLSFLIFLTDSSGNFDVLFISSRLVDNGGAATSEILLKIK